jgi:hypothetical protein
MEKDFVAKVSDFTINVLDDERREANIRRVLHHLLAHTLDPDECRSIGMMLGYDKPNELHEDVMALCVQCYKADD